MSRGLRDALPCHTHASAGRRWRALLLPEAELACSAFTRPSSQGPALKAQLSLGAPLCDVHAAATLLHPCPAECSVIHHALLVGQELVAAADNLQPDEVSCCQSCLARQDECNAWTYCPEAGGCAVAATPGVLAAAATAGDGAAALRAPHRGCRLLKGPAFRLHKDSPELAMQGLSVPFVSGEPHWRWIALLPGPAGAFPSLLAHSAPFQALFCPLVCHLVRDRPPPPLPAGTPVTISLPVLPNYSVRPGTDLARGLSYACEQSLVYSGCIIQGKVEVSILSFRKGAGAGTAQACCSGCTPVVCLSVPGVAVAGATAPVLGPHAWWGGGGVGAGGSTRRGCFCAQLQLQPTSTSASSAPTLHRCCCALPPQELAAICDSDPLCKAFVYLPNGVDSLSEVSPAHGALRHAARPVCWCEPQPRLASLRPLLCTSLPVTTLA